jgi:two-component system CheB/CheR fusion protein
LTEADERVPVVGIGASAGGIEALRAFFSDLPESTGLAYVVVQHLSPDHDSSLARIVSDVASMPVEQVNDGQVIKADHVYIIPPGKRLAVSGNHLVSEDQDREGVPATIDIFFRSLAEALQRQSACVILSGSGSDGAVGLRHVKESGGLVVVQDPREASYGGMPRSAIATGMADVVAPVGELGTRIVEWFHQDVAIEASDLEALPDREGEALQTIFGHLRSELDHDFSHYKEPTVLRRLERRMRVHGVTSLASYANLVQNDPDETESLFRDLLISVTNFFRDPGSFKNLEQTAIQHVFERVETEDDVRVWVPGCASGEEAYSIAILLDEARRRCNYTGNIQVFATDLDHAAVHKGRRGWYPEAVAADISPERLSTYFIPENNGYRVVQRIRETVLFAEHNLLQDPPFVDVDLVSCRNLMIYLDDVAQEQVLSVFHFSLRQGGWLFLGSSENIDSARRLFRVESDRHSLFRRRAVEGNVRLPSDLTDISARKRRLSTASRVSKTGIDEAHRQFMFKEYAPPSVIVDDHFTVRHYFGGVGKFLRPSEGMPSNSLLDLAPESVRPELRASLFQVFREGDPVGPRRLQVSLDGQMKNIALRVSPFQHGDEEDLAVVSFEESDAPPEYEPTSEDEDADVVEHLENELDRTRTRLHTVSEEFESTNEELKASNEELRSMNEELRSTTEELETRKEELQSTNEELQTVNQELEEKVREARKANADLRNLMAATEIGTVFVNERLEITRFTPAARDVFNLIEADVGRPFRHVSHQLEVDNLADRVEQVRSNSDPIEKEVRAHGDRWFLLRLLPYRAPDGDPGGVVITVIEVTKRKKAELEVIQQQKRYRRALRHSPVIFARIAPDLTYEWIINPHEDFDDETVRGKRDDDLDSGSGVDALVDLKRRAIETGTQTREEITFYRSDGPRTYDITVTPLRENKNDDSVTGAVTASLDITERKRVREKLRRLNEELEEEVASRTREARHLAKQLTRSEQRERDQIARRLHDDLQQLIYGAQLQNQMIQQKLSTVKDENLPEADGDGADADVADAGVADVIQDAAGLVGQLDDYLEEAIETTRALTVDLSPPVLQSDGLMEALQWLRSHMNDMHGLSVTLSGEGPAMPLPTDLRMMLFHVVRELLFNVVKHADTNEADVRLRPAVPAKPSDAQFSDAADVPGIRIVVADEGAGFDVDAMLAREPSGFGLPDVKRRIEFVGGSLEIESALGEGTVCTIDLPNASIREDRPAAGSEHP